MKKDPARAALGVRGEYGFCWTVLHFFQLEETKKTNVEQDDRQATTCQAQVLLVLAQDIRQKDQIKHTYSLKLSILLRG